MNNISRLLARYKTQLLPISLVAVLAILSLVINGYVQKNQEFRSKAAADNGQLTLTSLTSTTLSPGQTFDVAVNLVNGGQAVVGADILVQFDSSKLSLQSITPGTSSVFKSFVPVSTTGTFDSARVIASANNATTGGTVEFGIVSFDWITNALTSPTASNTTMSPVATLRFLVKTGATGSSIIGIKNDGINATTDSNIVVVPTGGLPEDILQVAPYANDRVSLTISTVGPSPTAAASPTTSPSNNPSPSPSGSACTVRQCQNYNGSSVIDISDIQTIAFRYLAKTGDSNYGIQYDFDCNGLINILDIQKQAFKYNQVCP